MMRVWWWCWHDWRQSDRQSDESFTSRLAEMVEMHTSGGPSILLTNWRNLWDAGTRMHNPPWIGTYKCCAMNTIRSNSRSMYTACHLWMTLWIVRNTNIVNLKFVRHKFVELGWEIIGMSSEFTQSDKNERWIIVCFGLCVMYGWDKTNGLTGHSRQDYMTLGHWWVVTAPSELTKYDETLSNFGMVGREDVLSARCLLHPCLVRDDWVDQG